MITQKPVWTPEQDAILMANRATSHDALSRMVSRVGPARTLQAVKDRRQSLGLTGRQSEFWTPEREVEVARLWAQGMSCSQVAAALGVGATRNAIIGKVNRLKLPKRSALAHMESSRMSRRNSGRCANPPLPKAKKPEMVAASAGPSMKTAPLPKATGPVDGSLSLRLHESGGDRGCRWITEGEGGNAKFCCLPTVGSSYCAHHHAAAYRPMPAPTVKPNLMRSRAA